MEMKITMIDIHSHILPNIDDGAKNIEETMNLLKEAQQVGFESVILTSHYMEGYYETATNEREILMQAISQKFNQYHINLDLYLGSEIYFSDNIVKLLEEGKACTINNTSYVLFELPLNAEPLNLYDIVYEMIQCKIVPILAHPERYSFVQRNPEIISDLIELGVLMQVNYASIIGYYGERAQIIVKKMLENNMVHLLGSDVHSPNTIYPKIPEILSNIKEIIGDKKLEKLTTINPNLILKNKRIEIEEPNNIELTLKEKLMLKLKR